MNNIYLPYTYLIGWTKYDKWYYGSRYAKGCNPSDLWVTYFTSSTHVKKFREEFGEPDVVEVRRTFSDPKKAKLWECTVQERIPRAVRQSHWLNKIFGTTYRGCVPTEESAKKISESKIGVKRPPHVIAKLRAGYAAYALAKPAPTEAELEHLHRMSKKIAESRRGKPLPDAIKAKLRISMRNPLLKRRGKNRPKVIDT
jgi:hypothetical protein